MIAHEAISKDAKASLRRVGLEAVEIGAAVGIGEENPLLVNAALRDVVRRSHGDGARKSGHLLESGAGGRFLSSYHISPSPKFPKFPKFRPKFQSAGLAGVNGGRTGHLIDQAATLTQKLLLSAELGQNAAETVGVNTTGNCIP